MASYMVKRAEDVLPGDYIMHGGAFRKVLRAEPFVDNGSFAISIRIEYKDRPLRYMADILVKVRDDDNPPPAVEGKPSDDAKPLNEDTVPGWYLGLIGLQTVDEMIAFLKDTSVDQAARIVGALVWLRDYSALNKKQQEEIDILKADNARLRAELDAAKANPLLTATLDENGTMTVTQMPAPAAQPSTDKGIVELMMDEGFDASLTGIIARWQHVHWDWKVNSDGEAEVWDGDRHCICWKTGDVEDERAIDDAQKVAYAPMDIRFLLAKLKATAADNARLQAELAQVKAINTAFEREATQRIIDAGQKIAKLKSEMTPAVHAPLVTAKGKVVTPGSALPSETADNDIDEAWLTKFNAMPEKTPTDRLFKGVVAWAKIDEPILCDVCKTVHRPLSEECPGPKVSERPASETPKLSNAIKLTPAQHKLLLSWAGLAPRVRRPDGRVHNALVRRGFLERNPDEEGAYYRISDLGRAALADASKER